VPLELIDFFSPISFVSNQASRFHRIDEPLGLERGAVEDRNHGGP
jgi:hypothetical protein